MIQSKCKSRHNPKTGLFDVQEGIHIRRK